MKQLYIVSSPSYVHCQSNFSSRKNSPKREVIVVDIIGPKK
jgi:hypothetical protein